MKRVKEEIKFNKLVKFKVLFSLEDKMIDDNFIVSEKVYPSKYNVFYRSQLPEKLYTRGNGFCSCIKFGIFKNTKSIWLYCILYVF